MKNFARGLLTIQRLDLQTISLKADRSRALPVCASFSVSVPQSSSRGESHPFRAQGPEIPLTPFSGIFYAGRLFTFPHKLPGINAVRITLLFGVTYENVTKNNLNWFIMNNMRTCRLL
jgi:hypothetical protein